MEWLPQLIIIFVLSLLFWLFDVHTMHRHLPRVTFSLSYQFPLSSCESLIASLPPLPPSLPPSRFDWITALLFLTPSKLLSS